MEHDRDALAAPSQVAPVTAVAEDEERPEGILDDAEEDCGPSFFEEEATCQSILTRAAAMLPEDRRTLLPTIGQEPEGAAALLEVKFAAILDRYQENAYLLHPYLEGLMAPLVTLLIRYLPPAEEWWQASSAPPVTAAVDDKSTAAGPCQSPRDAAAGENPFVVQGNVLGQNFDMFDADAPKNALHLVCRAIYLLTKTAREKACTSYFPNDTKHYEDVYYALRHWRLDPACQREWEVRYCLLLWLSNLVLVPFDLNLIDTTLAQAVPAASSSPSPSVTASNSLADALLVTSVGFLADTSKCREGAALLTARLLTRPDSQRHRDGFFRYVSCVLSTATTTTPPAAASSQASGASLVEALVAATATCHTTFLLPGVLLAVAKTMKLGKREELVVYASTGLLSSVVAMYRARTVDALLCKTAIKVVQRLVLSMLRKTAPNWRYERHVASLHANLTSDATTAVATPPHAPTEEEEETEAVIEGDEEALEDGIGALLEAIGHKDTIVRWSAAKGIGRVCARLPVAMAEEVIDALMADAFSSAYNDNQWHGGLLALAELCRRSMISAAQLPQVVDVVARGFAFDLSKGTYSVGSHVRDAACYTCWSIARAYDAVDLEAHVHRLSASLVVTALFDREVNVRRAAAAAFQECVGRLGNFADGIALVTTMDFFSLASLNNAYTVVAPRVAVYDHYRPSMIRALVETRLLHWDRRVRQAAAAALGAIAPLEVTSAIRTEVLPTLLRRVVDEAVAARHGAVLGLAALVTSLPAAVWSAEECQALAEVLTRLDAARLFRSRGGEYMRDAMCHLLRAFAVARLPLPETVSVTKLSGAPAKARTLGRCQEFLEDTWKNILGWLQRTAADTFCVFAEAYYTEFQAAFHGKVMAKLLAGCAAGTSPMERRGFLAAMGGVPLPLLLAPAPPEEGEAEPALYATRVQEVLHTACLVAPGEDPELADAEGRQNAVRSLGEVTVRVPRASRASSAASFEAVVATLLAALDDYAVDKRGDVGSFVRVASLHALSVVLRHACPRGGDADNVDDGGKRAEASRGVTAEACVRVWQAVIKVLLEKLDRVRGAAGLALCELLASSDSNGADDFFAACTEGVDGSAPRHAALCAVRNVVRSHAGAMAWTSPAQVFPCVTPVLLTQPGAAVFGLSAMEGLVLSAGDVSGHVHEPATQALLAVARGDHDCCSEEESDAARQERLSGYLVAVAEKYTHCERVLVPLSRTVDVCLNQALFHERWHTDMVAVLRRELKHYALAIGVLLPLVTLLTSLCRSPNAAARVSAWSLTLTMIASRYPKVRQKVATEFYTSLLVLSSAPASSPAEDPSAGVDYARAMGHLLATQWDGAEAAKIRHARDALYDMLHITRPSASAAGTEALSAEAEVGAESKKGQRGAVASSYMSLVRETGY